jgi:hypothetical protein
MRNFVDRCMWRSVAGTTADFVVNNAITGYGTPATTGAVDGFYSYAAESDDLSEWETGYGVYTSANTTLVRTQINQSTNSDAAVNFTVAPKVMLTITAEDVSGFGQTLAIARGAALP